MISRKGNNIILTLIATVDYKLLVTTNVPTTAVNLPDMFQPWYPNIYELLVGQSRTGFGYLGPCYRGNYMY